MRRTFRIILSILSGVMLSLPWLGFPGWILFAAFMPLLGLDDYINRHKSEFRGVTFWGYSFLTFLIWNGMTTWWIVHATVAGMIMAVFLNSFFMSLVFWMAHTIRRHSKASQGFLAFIVFWISFELIHFHWDIEWPWLTLGNGFANNIRMIQWYEFTGTLGGSLWIWLVNIFLFSLLKAVAVNPAVKRSVILGGTLLFLIVFPVIVSQVMYSRYTEKVNPRNVLIIQPNIDPYSETHDQGAVNDKLLKFIRLTEKQLTSGIDYIVGPETVFEQNWNEDNLTEYPAFRQLQILVQNEGHASLVIGASTFKMYTEGEKIPSSARHSPNGLVYDVFNTALFINPSGYHQVYHKSILVSGVEKMPYRKYLKFLEGLIINLGGTSGSLGIQPVPTNFEAPNGDRIATPICYESVFGGYLTEFVKKGAGVIFIITNDGWWKNTPGYRQHLSFARLRAIETRRSIVRSANTGISGIINQRGDIIRRSQWWEEATISGQFNYNDRLTVYAKYGDYTGRAALLLAVLMLLNFIVFRIIQGKKNPHQF